VERGERDREDHERQEHEDRRSGQQRDLESHPGTAAAACGRSRRSRGRGLAGRVPDLSRALRLAPGGGVSTQGVAHRVLTQSLAAAALVFATMSAALPWPAITLTTAVFMALPTLWPYSVSRNWMA